MTRNRKRKTDKGTFTEEMMRRAVNLVMAESVSIRQAAERSGIKFSTLQRTQALQNMFAYIIVSAIVFPFYVCLFAWLWLFQKVLFFGIKLHFGHRHQPMDSPDLFWAVGEKYHNLINVLFVLNHKEEGDQNLEEDIKLIIQQKVIEQPEKMGKMMCSLRKLFGYPYLIREKVIPEDFVTVLDVRTNSKLMSVEDILFNYSNTGMPKNNKLLWEIIVIKASATWKNHNNIKETQTPIFIRFNHVIADGLSIMNMLATVFGENEVNLDDSLKNIPKSPAWTKIPAVENFKKLLMFFIVPGYMIVEFVKGELARFEGPTTSFKQIGAYRAEKKDENLLQTVKYIKNSIGDTSFSEVILTAISASLYTYFEQNYHRVPKSLALAFVATTDLKPMNVNGVPALRNQFGLINVDIPITLETKSLLKRMEKLKKSTRDVKRTPYLLINNFIFFHVLHILPLPLIKIFVHLNGVFGIVSNLPELPKLVVFNGYEIEAGYFFTPQRDQMATGFTIISYDNRIHFGFVADIASVSTKGDCEEIIQEIFNNIELMKQEVEQNKIRRRRIST